VEERDVAQAAARNPCVHPRLEFRGGAYTCEVVELLRKQRSPVRVTSVEADALAFQKTDPFLDDAAMIVESSWSELGVMLVFS
jgi:hypothetical protein